MMPICLIFFSPDYSGKLFEVENQFFAVAKKRPKEALFVICKNGLKRKNLQRKAGLASNKKKRQKK